MKRILVVDDEPDILLMLRTVLTIAGYHVECARNGEEAFGKYAFAKHCNTPFDLLILDLGMPYRNGFEVAEIIRSTGDDETKIAFLSAFERELNSERSGEVDACGLWQKPFEPDDLVCRVRGCLGE